MDEFRRDYEKYRRDLAADPLLRTIIDCKNEEAFFEKEVPIVQEDSPFEKYMLSLGKDLPEEARIPEDRSLSSFVLKHLGVCYCKEARTPDIGELKEYMVDVFRVLSKYAHCVTCFSEASTDFCASLYATLKQLEDVDLSELFED